MFELLINNFKEKSYYNTSELVTNDILPDFGPTKAFSSEDGVSFYGLVSGNSVTLSNLCNYRVGITEPSRTHAGWIKVSIDGRIIFIAKRCYRVSIGADSNIPNQLLTIEGRQYRLRTLDHGMTDQQIGIGGGTLDRPIFHGSEWNRTMYRLCKYNTGVSGEGITYGSLVELIPKEIDIVPLGVDGCYSVIRRLSSNNSAARYSQNGSSSGSWAGAIAGNPKVIGWRPILELID